ncbi:uncharacterized protein LOC144123737 [Amblyomma americanum]
MPKDSSPTSAALPPTVVCAGALRQRDSAVFSGTGDHDVEDWLTSYERVSTHNKWDDALKLNNVIFYLTDVANLWYRNHEAGITSWSAFKQNFADVFGRSAVRKLRAEQLLRARAQLPGENFTSYIEDVVDLCSRADSSMPERAKIDHILKGIDDDAFQMLLAKNPATVVNVIAQCQSYDELRKRRLLTRSPLSNPEPLGALTSDSDHSTLLPQIKQFVREEVARQLSLIHPSPDAPSPLGFSLHRVIREQVAEALPTLSEVHSVPPLSYTEAATHYSPLHSCGGVLDVRRMGCAASACGVFTQFACPASGTGPTSGPSSSSLFATLKPLAHTGQSAYMLFVRFRRPRGTPLSSPYGRPSSVCAFSLLTPAFSGCSTSGILCQRPASVYDLSIPVPTSPFTVAYAPSPYVR